MKHCVKLRKAAPQRTRRFQDNALMDSDTPRECLEFSASCLSEASESAGSLVVPFVWWSLGHLLGISCGFLPGAILAFSEAHPQAVLNHPNSHRHKYSLDPKCNLTPSLSHSQAKQLKTTWTKTQPASSSAETKPTFSLSQTRNLSKLRKT